MELETVLNWALPGFSVPFTVTAPILIWKYFLYRRDINIKFQSPNKYFSSKQNVENIKKNLKIKLLISNFILVLLAVELLNNVCIIFIWTMLNLVHSNQLVELSCNDTNDSNVFKFGYSPLTWVYLLPINISSSLSIIILPIVCLLLNTLKSAYLNHPYIKTMKRGIAIIVLKFIFVFALAITIQTYLLVLFIKAVLFTIDFILYVYYTYKFYGVLKGQKIEARWHLTKRDFKEKSKILTKYVFTTVLTMFLFFILDLGYLVSVPLFLIEEYLQTSCVMDYLTLGIFPNININYYEDMILSRLYIYVSTAKYIITITHQFGIFSVYFAVCIRLLIVEYKRQKKLKDVNKQIHKMVVKFQDAIYNEYTPHLRS